MATTPNLLHRLDIDTDLTIRIISGFIKDQIEKVGMTRAVLALSGGIDSALSAYLTARAIGPENLLVVRMPYRTSAKNSLDDAEAVIEDLGLPSLTVEITPMVDPLIAQFPDMSSVRKGNIMARQRMIIQYDQSVAWGGLVIGTSNKTEFL